MRLNFVLLSASLFLSATTGFAQKKNVPPPPAPSSSGAAKNELPMDIQLMNVINTYCDYQLVEYKLMNGADPNYKNQDASLGIKVGDNALIAALRRPCNEKSIKRMVTGKVPYIINHIDVKKADIEGVGVDGVTPLVLAVKLDDVSIVKMILEAGADPNRKMVSTDPALNGKSAFDFLDGKKHEKRMRKALKKERD